MYINPRGIVCGAEPLIIEGGEWRRGRGSFISSPTFSKSGANEKTEECDIYNTVFPRSFTIGRKLCPDCKYLHLYLLFSVLQREIK